MRKLKREIWHHCITITDPRLAEQVDTWLGLNMGRFKQRWNVVYNYQSTDYYFKDSKDAIIFALRWS